MFVMKGKYNIAKIYLPDESHLDDSTKNQIQTFLNHPAFKSEPICIMPDTHAGKGAVIGFTMKMNDYVIPNIVGCDIGCGMLSYNLGKIGMKLNLADLDKFIIEHIPSGFKINNWKKPEEKFNEYSDLLSKGIYICKIQKVIGKMNLKPTKYYDFLNSIGSLGSGNHFLELGKDESDNIWLTIHSGSRNFGLQIANYHQNKAKELVKRFFLDENQYKDLEFLPLIHGGSGYLEDMKVAQEYASLNRRVMLYRIVRGFFKQDYLDLDNQIESVHNYINFEDYIIRKGAIQANIGQKVVIPFNMEDGLIIGEGLGNKDWNYSAPHGAGRLMSRTRAKVELNLNDAKISMEKAGIYTTSLDESTLDEIKGAYKDKDMIIEMIKETVKIEHFVKPIYNFKAGE